MTRSRRPPYRRRLRFTREGYAFCGITLAIGVAAINTGNNLLFLVLGALLSLILLSGVVSDLALRRLSSKRLLPQRIYAGRPVQLGYALANGKPRLSTLSVDVEEVEPAEPLRPCYFLTVPPRGQRTTTYEATFGRRGRVRLEGLRISTGFPFGFFRKSVELTSPAELLVFPMVRPVVLPHAPTSPLPGDHTDARPTRRGEFHGLRDHRPGDDVRDIHWRKSAQRGRPVVKEHHDDTLRRVVLVLDNRIPPGANEADRKAYEHSVSIAASLAHRYIRAGYEVALHLDPAPPTPEIAAEREMAAEPAAGARATSGVAPGRGQDHLLRILSALALVEPVVIDRGLPAEAPKRHGKRPPKTPGSFGRLHVSGDTVKWASWG